MTTRDSRWLALGAVAGPALLTVAFTPTAEGVQTGVAGLTERILVVELQAWCVAVGWLAFRRSRQNETLAYS